MSLNKQKRPERKNVRRSVTRLLAVAVAAMALVPASTLVTQAQNSGAFHEIETKYIFGNFTVGSSTGIEGEKAFEPETQASFGKRGGQYAVGATTLEYEYTPTQYMQIIFGPIVSYYNIHNVPDLDDRHLATVSGFEAEFRSVLIDRGPSPLAVTLSLEPEFHSRDETSGAKVVNYGLETRLEADAELIKNRLFLGVNLLYEPETTRGDLGMWSKESTFGVSSALAFQIVPNVVVGADLWYLRHYDGALFNSFTGDAVYLGPTFYWKIAPKVLMSAAWEAQIAGHEAGVGAALDLVDFSRYRARLLFEFEF
ncbi:MAG TPA: hypothetical protein VK653_03610 [Xanthobacteraceae bacterium]|nr:hypothetical protein [Xanthobacteraceae bacterium]